jgi:hypothetical protein
MRKVLAILSSGIMFIAGMHVSIDRHFCGGELAATKISVTGELASCGMETHKPEFPGVVSLNNKCCEDHVTLLDVSNNFAPEYFKVSYPSENKEIPSFQLLNVSLKPFEAENISTWVVPPGDDIKQALTLSKICVLRI